jgi:glycosyltransferase involved in cell wall biosynthesis
MPISQSLDVDSQDLISVCIPAYNDETLIAATLESVLSRTHRHFEIIATDDPSTDSTVPAIKRFSDPRTRPVQNDANLGFAGNWNNALSRPRDREASSSGSGLVTM